MPDGNALLVLLLILLSIVLLINALGTSLVCLIAGSMVFSEWYRQRCTTSEHGMDTGAYKVVPDALGNPKLMPDDDDGDEPSTLTEPEDEAREYFWTNYKRS